MVDVNWTAISRHPPSEEEEEVEFIPLGYKINKERFEKLISSLSTLNVN